MFKNFISQQVKLKPQKGFLSEVQFDMRSNLGFSNQSELGRLIYVDKNKYCPLKFIDTWDQGVIIQMYPSEC